MKLSKLRRLIREIVIREADKAGQQQLKPGQYWYVEASYPASWYDDFEKRRKVEKAIRAAANTVGIRSSGSGLGFGRRDIGFETRDEEKAKKFMSLVRKIPGVKVWMDLF
jgi:hypothetical protein